MLIRALLSPLSFLRLPARTWGWIGLYMAACAAVLGLVRELVVRNQDRMAEWILAYVFPDSWHFAARHAVEYFLASQQRVVVNNAIIAGSLMVVTTTLFWLKEYVSASFERGAGLSDRPIDEHPLRQQAWQEVKLFLVFLAVQGTVFWIGYHPGAVWQWTAITLSYLFLFFTFAIDFVSPIFQRHLGRYSQIVKTLVRHFPASLCFGGMFASLPIVASKMWTWNPEWSLAKALTLIFAVNVVAVVWACIAGTWLGSGMLPTLYNQTRASTGSRILSWIVIVVLLVANSYAFTSVGLAVHHKSQILKCHYDIQWTSFRIERPSLGSLIGGTPRVSVSFELEIQNPTPFDVVIEDNRVELLHEGETIATSLLSPLTVPAGGTRTPRVSLSVSVELRAIRKGLSLFERDKLKGIMYVEVGPGLEFPVYLFGYDE